MKRSYTHTLGLILTLSLGSALTLPGCASWAQSYRDSPATAFARDVALMNAALGVARSAVAATGDANALSQYEHIAGQVQLGLATAVDGVRIGENAGSGNIDYNSLLRDARSGMTNLNAFINGFSTPPGRAATPLMREASRLTARAAGITPTSD